MNTKSLPNLSPKAASQKRTTTIMMLVVLLLTGIAIAALIASRPTAYPAVEANVVSQSSQLSSISVAVNPSIRSEGPGHDYGAIYNGIDPGANPKAKLAPFSYTVAGQQVVRRSELGPLTEAVADPPRKHGPGRDYGSIGCADDPVAPFDTGQSPFNYTIAGNLIVRKSELGPLTQLVDTTVIACLP